MIYDGYNKNKNKIFQQILCGEYIKISQTMTNYINIILSIFKTLR